MDIDTDASEGSSYTSGEVSGKHIERLSLKDGRYKKDDTGAWVPLEGQDEDLHALQEIFSMMGSPLYFLAQDGATNTQAPETMHGVKVDHYAWVSGETTTGAWVDPKTGYVHKISLCSTVSGSTTESCIAWTYSKQNEPVGIVKLAGGKVPTRVPPTPTAVAVWQTEPASSPVCGEWRYMLDGDWTSMVGGSDVTHGIAAAVATGNEEVWTAIYQSPSAGVVGWSADGLGRAAAVQKEGEFSSLAATGPKDVWAVGDLLGDTRNAITVHWDGAKWEVVPSPNGEDSNSLSDVVAIGPDDAWAVGTQGPLTVYRTLTMHWNGKEWSTVSSPNPSTPAGPFEQNILNAVSGVAANDVWAVGYYEDAEQNRPALTMHWNGTQWQVVPSSVLAELSAVGSHYDPDAQRAEAVILHWDGTTWRKIDYPAGNDLIHIGVVAAHSSKDVWAAHGPSLGMAGSRVLLHWDGQAWSRVEVPGSEGVTFEAIVPLGPGRTWFGGTGKESGRAFVALLTEKPSAGR